MSRNASTVLLAVSTVLAVVVIVFAAYASLLSLRLPEPRTYPHIPCLISQPLCDEPMKGIWTAP